MLCALDADREAVAGEAFNVGADSENYRIREIAEIVARTFPGCELTIGEPGGDTRSYRVSFAKIRKHLPKFETAWDRRARRPPAQDDLRPHRPHPRDVRGRALHPAEGAPLPAGDRAGRPGAALERPGAGLSRVLGG